MGHTPPRIFDGFCESDVEWLSERAAILEFEAGMSREEAELAAVDMLTRSTKTG
jgi:hypothetical protein